jgi:hypothetical protein
MEALHSSMEEPDRLNTYRPQMLQEVLALASQNTAKVTTGSCLCGATILAVPMVPPLPPLCLPMCSEQLHQRHSL